MATQAKEKRTGRVSLNPNSKFGPNQHSGFGESHIASFDENLRIAIAV